MISLEEIQTVQNEADCIFTHSEIEKKIDNLSQLITKDLYDHNPIFICILNGGLLFSASLLSKLSFPLQVDYMHLTRYQGDLSGSEIRWFAKPQLDLKGRVVILLDDILDLGISMQAAKEYCALQGAEKVFSVVLLKKKLQDELQVETADYVGFECPDKYVFGFGMDYKNYCRNLNAIYALRN
jgi:hypoxanthine phosphoribosyltransferase